MRYREITPTQYLSPFVECFWTLEGDATAEPVHLERILPDGCVELILNFGAQFREHKDNGQEERQPMSFIVGQMTRPMLISPTGPVRLIGIRFHPGGTFPFFRVPMDEVTNRVVELSALSGDLEREFLSVVGEAPSFGTKIIALEKLLADRVRDCKHDSWLIGITTEIIRRGGQVSIAQLATDAGISSRQLERRFLQEVGLPPKLLCRILRFQQVFRAVDRNDPGWARVAADCGYFDQAHLIRDFKQFARQTPSILFAHSSPLTESFTRKNRAS